MSAAHGSHGSHGSAPAAGHPPGPHGDLRDDLSTEAWSAAFKTLIAGMGVSAPAARLARVLKDAPAREFLVKAAARLGSGVIANAVARAVAPETEVARWAHTIEQALTGSAFGGIDHLSELEEHEIDEALTKQVKAIAVGHTAAVAVGVPTAKPYVWIDGPSQYKTGYFHLVVFQPDGTTMFRPTRPDVIDDILVPYTEDDDFGRKADLYFEENGVKESEVVEETGGGKPGPGGKAPHKATKRQKRRVPSDKQLRIRYGDALELEAKIARGEILPHPSIADWHDRVIAARAEKAKVAEGHDAHGHEHDKKEKKSLLQLAREGGHTEIVRVLNALSRSTLNSLQKLRKDDILGDVERAGASKEVLEALNEFCEEIPDNRVLTAEEVDAFLTWIDDNVPGVEEDRATTWGGWAWQKRRAAYRIIGKWSGAAVIAAVILAVLLLIPIVWTIVQVVKLIGLIWTFFTGAFAAAGVDVVNPGGWAVTSTTDLFAKMMAGDLSAVWAGTLLLGILCTVISVFGQMLFIRLRLAEEKSEAFRNVGRDCAQFLAAFAALHTMFVVFGMPPNWSVMLVATLIATAFSQRMAYRSQGGMEATIRDNTRKTWQFMTFVLAPLTALAFVVKTWFPAAVVSLHASMGSLIGLGGIPIAAMLLIGLVWLGLTSREGVTAEDKKSYNTVAGYGLAIALLFALIPPVVSYVGQMSKDAASGMRDIWNGEDDDGKVASAPATSGNAPTPNAPAATTKPTTSAPRATAPTTPAAHSPSPVAPSSPISPAGIQASDRARQICAKLTPATRARRPECN